jgi:tRNA/tmRNA/rRNA uracil-C5-methylase (TrmA/RlmC/RlmD family)
MPQRSHFPRPNRRPRTTREATPPVLLQITEVGFGGDGVARHEGKVWFVPLTLPGETVWARAREVKKSFVRGELVSVQQRSPQRVEPPCRYFGQCGGCRYQHAGIELQREIKHQQVVSLLQRIAGVDGSLVAPVLGAEPIWNYRNRITLHIRDGIVGFHRLHGEGLLDIEECALADQSINKALTAFRRRRPFDGHRTLRSHNEVAGFRQTNDAVAALLLDHLRQGLHPGGDLLIDAYGGSGFFARGLQELFPRRIIIDWSASAMAKARETAQPGEEFLEMDVAEGLARVASENTSPAATLLLDPPSVGLEKPVLQQISHLTLDRLVYVSCDPATFARDAKHLAPSWQLTRVQPFDMFPHTAEIEVVGWFERAI